MTPTVVMAAFVIGMVGLWTVVAIRADLKRARRAARRAEVLSLLEMAHRLGEELERQRAVDAGNKRIRMLENIEHRKLQEITARIRANSLRRSER